MLGNTFSLHDLGMALTQPQTSAELRARVMLAQRFDPAKNVAWRTSRPLYARQVSAGPVERLDQQWAGFQVGYATQGVGAFLPYEIAEADELAVARRGMGVIPEWERGVRVPRVSSPTMTLADLAQTAEAEGVAKKSGLGAALPYLGLALLGLWIVPKLLKGSASSYD